LIHQIKRSLNIPSVSSGDRFVYCSFRYLVLAEILG
jgi:hypothetical protein